MNSSRFRKNSKSSNPESIKISGPEDEVRSHFLNCNSTIRFSDYYSFILYIKDITFFLQNIILLMKEMYYGQINMKCIFLISNKGRN